MIRARDIEPAPVAKAEQPKAEQPPVSNVVSNSRPVVRRSKDGPRSSAEAWRTYHRELMARRRVKLRADQVALALMDPDAVGQRATLADAHGRPSCAALAKAELTGMKESPNDR